MFQSTGRNVLLHGDAPVMSRSHTISSPSRATSTSPKCWKPSNGEVSAAGGAFTNTASGPNAGSGAFGPTRWSHADPDMAEAWLRLRSGRAQPSDIALLEHELAEARCWQQNPSASYRDAHAAANGVSRWETQVPPASDEDYGKPWR